MGIRMCNYSVDSPVENLAASKNALSPEQRRKVTAAAWFQQIARRICEAGFFQEFKNRPAAPACALARTYIFNVRESFFQPTPLARAEALYNAYLASPKLSSEAIKLVAQEGNVSEQDAWNKVNNEAEWLWIQALMQSETTARITIVKNALDDVIERGALPPPRATLKVGALSVDFPLNALPPSYHSGLRLVRDHPYSSHLPYLFQAFVDLLGGFILYRDDEELSFLQALTSVPKDEIVDALKILDTFFAPEGGSVFYIQKGEILRMKMIPATVSGGGAFFRRIVFGIQDYNSKFPHMGWLVSQWHNALYQVLEPYLKKD
jgi:hypothetical protein